MEEKSSNHCWSDHKRIDERSTALHAAVANRLRQNPQLLEIVKANLRTYLDRFASENRTPPEALMEWQDVLKDMSLQELTEFIVSGGERSRRLRQSSPFAGVLSTHERWKIYEAFRPGAYYSGRGKHHRRR